MNMPPKAGADRGSHRMRSHLEGGLSDLALGASLVDPLMAYLQELQRWNKAYNLTAIRDPGAGSWLGELSIGDLWQL